MQNTRLCREIIYIDIHRFILINYKLFQNPFNELDFEHMMMCIWSWLNLAMTHPITLAFYQGTQ